MYINNNDDNDDKCYRCCMCIDFITKNKYIHTYIYVCIIHMLPFAYFATPLIWHTHSDYGFEQQLCYLCHFCRDILLGAGFICLSIAL